MKRIFFLVLLSFSFGIQVQARQWHRPDTRIPYRMVNGKMIVDVRIGGKMRPFLLDTGSPWTLITDDLNAELGHLKILNLQVIGSAGGPVIPMSIARLDSLGVGDWLITGHKIGMVNGGFPMFKCLGVEGIIGSDILQKSVLHISSRDSVLILSRNADRLPIGSDEPLKVSLRNGQRPYVRISGRNGNRKASHWALLDIGAAFYACNSNDFQFMEQRGVFREGEKGCGRSSYGLAGVEIPREQARAMLPELWIGRVCLEQVPVRTTQSNSSLLGTFLLEYGDITIDYRKKRFHYTVFEKKRRMQPEWFPVSILFVEDRMIIGVVWDESLKPLLQAGDSVLSVNGQPAETFSVCDYFTGEFEMKSGMVLQVKTGAGKMIGITL